ncbi:Putative bacteriophage protein [Polaromonas sp. CG9_12]|nr:Putative bacteriophage protein [Polaromonas sp. CG9_12]
MSPIPKPARRYIDWAAIEPDWRAGVKSKQVLAQEHGISRAALNKHFSNPLVLRDLKGQINAEADALVTQSLVPPRQVTPQVTPPGQAVTPPAPRLSKAAIISVNAQSQAAIRIGHREDAARLRVFFGELMDELALRDADGKLAMPAITRAEVGKKAADILEKAVRLEREAHGIDKESAESPIDTALKLIAERKRHAG